MTKPVFIPFRRRSTNLMWVRSAVKQLLGLVLVWAAVVSPGVSDNTDCLWLQGSRDDQVHSLPASLLNTLGHQTTSSIVRKGGKHMTERKTRQQQTLFSSSFIDCTVSYLLLFAIPPRTEGKLALLLLLWCHLYISWKSFIKRTISHFVLQSFKH